MALESHPAPLFAVRSLAPVKLAFNTIILFRIVAYNHSLILSSGQALLLQETVIHSLADPSTEVRLPVPLMACSNTFQVRELACSAFTSLAMTEDDSTLENLKTDFLAILNRREKTGV